jgi:hypothetical protein
LHNAYKLAPVDIVATMRCLFGSVRLKKVRHSGICRNPDTTQAEILEFGIVCR